MNAAISQAAIKQPFKVLGRKLKPFSLWHQTILEFFESGFAVGAQYDPTYEDLILSVFFCSYDYTGGMEELESRTLRTRLKLWGWYCGNFDVLEAMRCFKKYVEYYSASPNYWLEQNNGSSKSGTSYAQFLKVKMMQEFGMSDTEALNTAYNSAIINYLTTLEARGVIRFMSQEDEELISQTRAMESRLQEIAKRVRNN
jgi:hypothetical protein